jgi:plastocyanin
MTKRLLMSVLLSVFAVACASSSSEVIPAASGSTTPPKESTSPSGGGLVDPREDGLEVGFGEWAIQLEAKAVRPGPITFVVHNGGTMTHGFEIQAQGADRDSSGPGSGDGLKLEANAFGPGDTVRVHASLAPGVYKIECFIANHDELGMETLLTVRKNAPLVRVHETAPNQVELDGFAFSPADLEVQVGAEVTWTNHAPTTHTVTADAGSFDSGALDPGATFSTTFAYPGEFTYMCQIHPTMKGKVTVVG